VVVVEKGTYTCAQELPLQEREAFGSMYEGGGLMTTDNAGMLYTSLSGIPLLVPTQLVGLYRTPMMGRLCPFRQ
jgi:hypothetical protein